MIIGGTDQSQRRAASRARPGDVTAVHGQETAARACAAAGARLTSDENRVATPNSPQNSPPFVHAKKLGHYSTKLGHGTKTKKPNQYKKLVQETGALLNETGPYILKRTNKLKQHRM